MEINKQYKPLYHACVPSGWANDPNGFVYYKDKIHLFYQHYPHKAKWGPMHWGHFTTQDFIHWENLPVALKPDEYYERECGCCSGTAIEKDGLLYLFYTAAQSDLQRQCMAVSEDGIHFKKNKDNPIITSDMLDEEVSPKDFRDPKIFYYKDQYYILAGTRILTSKDQEYLRTHYLNDEELTNNSSIGNISNPNPLGFSNGAGNMILLSSKDMFHWEYRGKLFEKQDDLPKEYFKLDGVYECPDIVMFDETDVLFASPQNLPMINNHYQNLHSAVFIKGHLNFDTGHFDIKDIQEIDQGFDFYAPQNIHLADGRNVMIAWKEMWDRTYPTETHNWIGTYTLPREVTYKDGHVYQLPVREIKKYQTHKVTYKDIDLTDKTVSFDDIKGNVIEIDVTFDIQEAIQIGIMVLKGSSHETMIYYDANQKCVIFDRRSSGIRIGGRERDTKERKCFIDNFETLKLQIFIDINSIEVFINDGKYVMSGNVYPDKEDIGVEFYSVKKGKIIEVTKYDIEV